jgi:hypothetical protein
MAKSPEEMLAAMIANLKQTTGKSIDEWLKIVASSKLAKHGEIVKHLKSEYGMGHGYANQIAQKALVAGKPEASVDDLLEAQYDGAKATLRSIYDTLISAVKKFGEDVEISPKKTYVSLRRNKQFGLIQATTATRVDVGVNLKGMKPTSRLEPSGSFNAMVSHRVRVAEKREVDAELVGWLKSAYDSS